MKFLCGGYQQPIREKLHVELHTETQHFAHQDTDMVLVKESTRRKRGPTVLCHRSVGTPTARLPVETKANRHSEGVSWD